MEKQRENQAPEEQLEHTVTIIGRVRKIKLDKGKKASDLIAAIKSKYKEDLANFSLNASTNVVLNAKTIKMNDKGELEENPILTRASTLSLMPQITGGHQ